MVQTREDILGVAVLAREIWTEHYLPIIGRRQVDYMLDKFQSESAIAEQIHSGHTYHTVWHEGVRTGYLALVPDKETEKVMISKLYVRKAARGLGLGRLMLEFAASVCRERHASALWLTVNKHNRHSLAWYTRMGFKNTGSVVQDIGGGFVMDDYRMEKKLTRNP